MVDRYIHIYRHIVATKMFLGPPRSVSHDKIHGVELGRDLIHRIRFDITVLNDMFM